MVPTELYRIFFFAASCRSLSEAASKLFISQPAISKSVRKLESELGCSLFARSSKGVALTVEGQVLYNYVKNAFESLQNGESMMEKLGNRTQGIVRIGISNTLCKYFFLPHLEAFHGRYPGIRIQIINRTSPETLLLLEKGRVDFGIISIPMEKGAFEYVELMEVTDTFVAGRKYDIGQAPLQVSNLTRYPLLMMEDKNLSRTYIDDYLISHHAEITPEIEVSSMELLIEFARIGLGAAAVIREFIGEELESGALREIPLAYPLPKRKIGIALKKQIPTSIACQTFVDFLKKRLG